MNARDAAIARAKSIVGQVVFNRPYEGAPYISFEDSNEVYTQGVDAEYEAYDALRDLLAHCAVDGSPVGDAAAQSKIRKLTLAELNHLSSLLTTEQESGSYAGPCEQYYARTERLIKWCEEQMLNIPK